MLVFSLVIIVLITALIFLVGRAEWHTHHPHLAHTENHRGRHRERSLAQQYHDVQRSEPMHARPEEAHAYRKRRMVMTSTETAFYRELERQIGKDFRIFPKMRIADVIETMHGSKYYVNRNKILPKHLDFVICNAWLQPILAIELNGPDHQRLERMHSDEQKRQALEEANMPLEIVPIGMQFSEAAARIISTYKLS